MQSAIDSVANTLVSEVWPVFRKLGIHGSVSLNVPSRPENMVTRASGCLNASAIGLLWDLHAASSCLRSSAGRRLCHASEHYSEDSIPGCFFSNLPFSGVAAACRLVWSSTR